MTFNLCACGCHREIDGPGTSTPQGLMRTGCVRRMKRDGAMFSRVRQDVVGEFHVGQRVLWARTDDVLRGRIHSEECDVLAVREVKIRVRYVLKGKIRTAWVLKERVRPLPTEAAA